MVRSDWLLAGLVNRRRHRTLGILVFMAEGTRTPQVACDSE
jgi:hypothetical protein